MLQIRITKRERIKLRVLCAELDISMQELVKRLLNAQFPGALAQAKNPRRFSELLSKDPFKDDKDDDETLA